MGSVKETEEAPGHAFQQKQNTWYFPLPDGTWLTVLTWEIITDFCWRHGKDLP